MERLKQLMEFGSDIIFNVCAINDKWRGGGKMRYSKFTT